MHILLVDDNDEILVLLSRQLQKWGHQVVTACDGAEAWHILQQVDIDLVVSDWMMPIMNGIELCRRIRDGRFENYIYFILLTAREEKQDLIRGMEAGADDFIVKPFDKDELQVRIRAGARIIQLQQDLAERNKKLSGAYSVIKKDLETAARMQQSLLPEDSKTISDFSFHWLFCPSGYVAGDIFNFFFLDDHHICFYMIDVAGHGVSAAMLSVTLSKLLSPASSASNLQEYFIPPSTRCEITPPAELMQELNRRFENEKDCMQYFTMLYGIIDTRKDLCRFSQAGHPSPIHIPSGQKAVFLGSGGFPVGLIPNAVYEETQVFFREGDRLLLYSDGVTDCANSNREHFSEKRLAQVLESGRSLPAAELLSHLEQNLKNWKGDRDFTDDVSVLAIEKSRTV